MTQPPHDPNQATVSFSVETVINRIHRTYSRVIVDLVNTNAELVAGNEALQSRVDELAAENTALRGIMADDTEDAKSNPVVLDDHAAGQKTEARALGCTEACDEGHTYAAGCALEPMPGGASSGG